MTQHVLCPLLSYTAHPNICKTDYHAQRTIPRPFNSRASFIQRLRLQESDCTYSLPLHVHSSGIPTNVFFCACLTGNAIHFESIVPKNTLATSDSRSTDTHVAMPSFFICIFSQMHDLLHSGVLTIMLVLHSRCRNGHFPVLFLFITGHCIRDTSSGICSVAQNSGYFRFARVVSFIAQSTHECSILIPILSHFSFLRLPASAIIGFPSGVSRSYNHHLTDNTDILIITVHEPVILILVQIHITVIFFLIVIIYIIYEQNSQLCRHIILTPFTDLLFSRYW